ncbi:glycine-rich RNA-binding protein 4, mitochondrial isoform X2 [Cryptomeria japonica]|uniref:glycine-rich RNA-binding protein 4, mitochondrial isoform X2 n=1 Tax=Cryptomeria japonica TaxID=3369 RepID=UPI0025AC78BB|nr:glycine-rich RNA-binding protein 4, mitochondrial isoform X2 [Cryptomeria japonica]
MALVLRLRYLFGGRSATIASSGYFPLLPIRELSTNSQLFIGGLSYDTNERVLKDAFSRYGEVLEGRSKGCGIVQFASETEADNARKEMDGVQLDGRNIRVEFPNSRPLRIGGAPQGTARPPSSLNKETFIEGLDD